MKKTGIVTTLFILFSIYAGAQGKFYSKTGKISFYSKTSVENIEAINKSTVVVLDSKTGDLQFAVLMKGFEFKKAVMQEDFNRDYAESNKFPRTEFKGQINNNSEINYTTDGNYNAKVNGKLTIHGETKDIQANGTITVKDGRIQIKSVFTVEVPDYKIRIPDIYKDHISSTIRITVDCSLDPLK